MQGSWFDQLKTSLPRTIPLARWTPRYPLASHAFKRVLDRFVFLAEESLGEEITERVVQLNQHLSDAELDPFGFDPETSRYALALAAFLHRWYFRTEVHGLENLPEGRMLLVGNHSGQIPVDGLLISTALALDAEPPRLGRNLVDTWTNTLPFVSTFFSRCGQVTGTPDNARRLLEADQALIVFPEGVKGIAKSYEQRYQLVDFGRGFVRLAIATRSPIVPVAVIGGEEQYLSLGSSDKLAKLLQWPVFPIVPQWWFGAVLPLPTKYHIVFGKPITFEGNPNDEDADVAEKVWTVKTTIETMLKAELERRRSVFF